MRHGTPGRRQRNRGPNNGGGAGGGQRRPNGPNRMQVYDSNGPDVRIRGTAHQVNEKYLILAKDAAASGDRVLAESYLQYAEHYQRIINSFDEGVQAPRPMVSSEMRSDEAFEESASVEDDLALPSSILGAVSQQTSQVSSERTSETAMG